MITFNNIESITALKENCRNVTLKVIGLIVKYVVSLYYNSEQKIIAPAKLQWEIYH